MKKIISLFQRNYAGDRKVRNEIVPGAEWVVTGEGVATRKWDGTCVMIRDGKMYKRYEVSKGKTAPSNFEPASDVDDVTGKQQGWLLVSDGPEDKWHREAFSQHAGYITDGTYELIGPKVQRNPEKFATHMLVPHGMEMLIGVPCTFDALREYLQTHDIEGIVWHHKDGRMVKIKAKDFGIKRKMEQFKK